MRQDIANHLDEHLVISAAHHPHLARSLNSYRHRGKLTAILPGIYARVGGQDDLDVRLAAAGAAPNGFVLVGRAAAKTQWWPELDVDTVDVASDGDLAPAYGFSFHQRYIPPALVLHRSPLPVTTPALTVLDLIPELGSDCVDEALRRRVVTLGHLHAALAMTPRRRGNVLRRQILADSRDAPWSPLERLAHRMLRGARIKGWTTNHPVVVDGVTYYLDIALTQLKIGIEIDGFEFHGDRRAFHADRTRDAQLTAAGWHVIRLSSENLSSLPDLLRGLIARRTLAHA